MNKNSCPRVCLCVCPSRNGETRRLTVDGERGRCLRLADHVLSHAGVGAHISRGQATNLQGVVLTNLISALQSVCVHVFVSNVFKHRKKPPKLFTQTCSGQHASPADKEQKWAEAQTKVGTGWGRYCLMKGNQVMSHTFLSAVHRRLSSSARWELGRHGPHTWTLHFDPLKPPGCLGDVQSWDALYQKQQKKKGKN